MPTGNALRHVVICCVALAIFEGASARGGIFADFEGGVVPPGWGALTNSSGVQPWAPPVAGAVVTPSSTPMAGGKVLELTGTASFNFGQSGGGALGFDFLTANLRADFLANDVLEFDWLAVPNGAPSGFSQLFNVILNSQGGGFVNVAGSSMGSPETQQGYFTGYNGIVHH